MSPDKQRIAIAEACGWKPKTYGPDWHPSETKMPDYCRDLNAMHAAEMVMTDYQKHHYLTHLRRIAVTPSFEAGRFVAFATAAQRAEAFLRTLDLWKP